MVHLVVGGANFSCGINGEDHLGCDIADVNGFIGVEGTLRCRSY